MFSFNGTCFHYLHLRPSLNFPFVTLFSALIVGLYVCTPMREPQAHVFPLQPSSLCSPGHSRSDLFYVSSVLIVTQPEVCSKTHRLMFSPSNPLLNFSLSFLSRSLSLSLSLSSFKSFSLSLSLSLSLFFPFKRNFWQHGTISEPFVGLRHVM